MTWPTIVVSPKELRPVPELNENDTPQETLQLFALMRHAWCASEGTHPPAEAPLARVLSLRNRVADWAALEEFLRTGVPPGTQNPIELPVPARAALETGYIHRHAFGVTTPRNLLDLGVCTLLAARSAAIGAEKAQRYREIADRHYQPALEHLTQLEKPTSHVPDEPAVQRVEPPPEASPAEAPSRWSVPIPDVSPADLAVILAPSRPDEEGQQLQSPAATLWHGSAMGRKSVNQDATFARLDRGCLYFALCDGVASSAASRQAAALASSVFVRAMAAAAPETNPEFSPLELFTGSGTAAQQQLEALRAWLLSSSASPWLPSIAAPLPESTMRIFLEKTVEGIDVRRVALATTLIGGYLLRGKDSQSYVRVARYGDGVVEHYRRRTGDVEQLMSMEAGRYRVDQYLSPLAATALTEPEMVERNVEPGDWLLLSSDGLGRGDGDSLWGELGRVLSAPPDQFFTAQGEAAVGAAFSLLSAYVAREEVPLDVFDDNWSLILIRIGEGGEM